MGLIDLKTDLKSLKYGKDTLGGGYSGQPYIQTSIPDSTNSLGPREDFLLRGGAVGAAADAATDIRRLTKMFTDTKSPNGTLFVAKQQLLSRTAPRTQTSGILNEGNYTPLSTLAQAGVVAFGGHLNKQGDPFSETGAYANNENLYLTKVKNENTAGINRLLNLYESSAKKASYKSKNGVIFNNGISDDGFSVNIMSYTGGPGSDLGQGNTNIRYASLDSRTDLSAPKTLTSFPQNTWVYNSNILLTPYTELSNVNTGSSPQNPGILNGSPTIQDFRKIIRTKLGSLTDQNKRTSTTSGATPLAPDYSTANYELKTNLGQPGQRSGKSYADYTKAVTDYKKITLQGIGNNPNRGFGLDKINSLPIYRSENVTQDPVVNDLIQFRIAIIDNDSPSFKTFIHFRAFLDSMSDSYNATWDGFQYLGRGEQFYTYKGFTRQISLGWTVAAQSKQELIPMYRKLNYLASSLTPDYSPLANNTGGYMRGVLCQLTVGGYLYEQPGFIISLTYTVPTESPWEIGIDVDGNSIYKNEQLPHIIQITGFQFIPIQTFLPRLAENRFTDDGENETKTGIVKNYGSSFAPQRYIHLPNPSVSVGPLEITKS